MNLETLWKNFHLIHIYLSFTYQCSVSVFAYIGTKIIGFTGKIIIFPKSNSQSFLWHVCAYTGNIFHKDKYGYLHKNIQNHNTCQRRDLYSKFWKTNVVKMSVGNMGIQFYNKLPSGIEEVP